ncbi:MAG TPA: TolC family protein, partial [Terriglobales bacterium]|nr:TolC family protein [Terriglobales bacterium]
MMVRGPKTSLKVKLLAGFLACTNVFAFGQSAALPSAPSSTFKLEMPKSHNPLGPYLGTDVPASPMANSSRLNQLVRDGKLYISLQDAISLALENNLDLAIARYNLPIADTDVLRTQAGGVFRGVNTGVVQGTPGGGIGGLGSGAPGGGAGGTTAGAGGAGAGASGLVQSTLGAGTFVNSYDPQLNINSGTEHQTQPLTNLILNNVPSLQTNSGVFNVNYSQAFATGSSISFEFDNNRLTTNSPNTSLSPSLNSFYRFTFRQELLAGFGFGPNLRYLQIAKNNKKISDIAFRDQVIATITQIENIYWDLVNAYQQAKVNEQSLNFAQQSFENSKKQLQLEAIPAMDVMKAEAEVSKRDQDLTVARTNLQLQESLIKNALTRSLDDAVLEEMPVVPTDTLQTLDIQTNQPIADLITQALNSRPELLESDVDLVNRKISRKAAKNALLPQLSLVGFYGGTGLAGELNPLFNTQGGGPNTSTLPTDLGGAINNAFNNSSP